MVHKSLKDAFHQAREANNLDLVLPAFLATQLYVVSKSIPTSDKPVFFIQRSPNPERLCLTASDDEGNLKSIEGVSLLKVAGADLLEMMNPAYELLLVYKDGGDYLTREQLSWFRDELNAQQ